MHGLVNSAEPPLLLLDKRCLENVDSVNKLLSRNGETQGKQNVGMLIKRTDGKYELGPTSTSKGIRKMERY